MEKYLVMRIESGNMDYKELFAIEKYQKYQSTVNSLLISDGKQNLIVN